MTAALRAFALLIVTLLALSACGGDDTADVGADVDTTEAERELRKQAEEVESIVEDEVRRLADIRSQDDLSSQLDEAKSKLEEKADEVEATEVREDLEDEREALESATRDLASELDDVKAELDEDDLRGALEELRGLDAVDDVDDAVDRIRAAS